jgi:alpha-L-arabinofuranosidase
MNRRDFLTRSTAAAATATLSNAPLIAGVTAEEPRVSVLVVDTDRASVPIDKRIYGQFLEHINHSVEDGLFAEQIRGAGFEGPDFQTYWEAIAKQGLVEIAEIGFQNGKKSVRLRADGGEAGIRQGRIFLEANTKYDGSLWIKRENGAPMLTLRVLGSNGNVVASVPLASAVTDWNEFPFSFTSLVRDTQAAIEIVASGHGSLLIDFVSLMRSDVRHDGMLRPDLLDALRGLEPSFIRWPGGSFASTYKWKEAIGPYAARGYHPNVYWGNYSDYAGFGTDEFLGLCKRLNCEPLVVLAAPTTRPVDLDYAMGWVHYLNDQSTTEWGRLRAQNGHPEPYNVRYFQIDNEPMNNGFTPESYAAIVNLYGSHLRAIAPNARIVACGQKRSSDMDWSEKVIDIAGENFDILGCHNYEYEPDNFASGIDRIRGYLIKLCDYIRSSRHPNIEVAVLEWSLQHTYDWRAGLHAAGSLIMYEELSPSLTMTCPALLMRNTTDDPKWTAAIYHDHVSWFPGGSYVVEKLFREHFAPRYLASTAGTVQDAPDRKLLFDKISTQIPFGWLADSVDAIATAGKDNRRIVIKVVNYRSNRNTLLVRLQGKDAPEHATATLHTITAKLSDQASLENPAAIAPVSRPFAYARDLAIDLDPYTVAVLEIVST